MGIAPGDFWSLTPYQTRMYVTAMRRETITQTWFSSRLNRADKVPPLEEMLDPKPAKPMDAKTFFMTNFKGRPKQMNGEATHG